MSYVIKAMPPQVPAEKIEKYRTVETAVVGHRRLMGFMDPEIQCVLPARRIAGTAVTLAVPGQDTTLLHHVIARLRPGDILCIDRLGDRRHACVGGGVAAALKAAGCIAAVVDGYCTDLPELRQHDFPVWARGVSPITARLYDIGGAFNVPISCGGVVVMPGDVVVADVSGVLVMPPEEAEGEADWALGLQAGEAELQARALAGEDLGDISGANALVKKRLQE